MAKSPSGGSSSGRAAAGSSRKRAGAGSTPSVNEAAAAAGAADETTASAPPPPPASARDRIVDATLALAAEQDWDSFDIREIATRAGVTLAEFRDAFPSKGAVLAGLSRRVDRIVLEGTGSELDDEPVRERLFDIMMRRLDALSPYKEGLRRISKGMRSDPLSLAALNQLALNSMRFMLAAAGVETAGPLGMIKVQGAVLVWSKVLDIWLDDDDPGLARTMAQLDKELRRSGQAVNALNDACRMAAPFRALFDRAAEGGRRLRERQRARRDDGPEDEDYAPAV